MADEILYAVADSIATITLNRPERRNALNTALMEALAHRFDALESGTSGRAVAIRGAGPDRPRRALRARPEARRDHRPGLHTADPPHRSAGRRRARLRDGDGAHGRPGRRPGARDLRSGEDDRRERAALARGDEVDDPTRAIAARASGA